MDLLEISLLIRLSQNKKYPLTDEQIWMMSGPNFELDLNFKCEQCQVIKDVFKKYNTPMCIYDECGGKENVKKLDKLYVSNDFLNTIKGLVDKYKSLEFSPSFATPAGDGYKYTVKIGYMLDDDELKILDRQFKFYAENWSDFINNFTIISITNSTFDNIIKIAEVRLVDNQLVIVVYSLDC